MKRSFLIITIALCSITTFCQKPEIIYHVFQRSFFDSNGDGHGDLKGMQHKLDYLQELGVTSILLMPLYQSDFYHNYFATDFEKIDPAFGSMEEYMSLVKEVHRRKMKIYQDVEMQYVTHKHPWFVDSYKNPSSAFDRYIYYYDEQNAKPYFFYDIPEFTTYNNLKQKIAVVNMNEPGVREYTYDVLKFWVDPNRDGEFDDGVDGFRLDHMMDNLDYSNKLTNLFEKFWTPVLTGLKKVNPEIRIIAEQANWGSFGHKYYSEGKVDRVFAFRLKFAIGSFDKKRIVAEADSTFLYLPEGKQQIVFIENHDTKRFASLEGQHIPKLKVGAALNLLMGGIPLIYYGQELGMEGEQMKGMTDGNDIPIREAFEWYQSAKGEGMAFWYKDTGIWWDSTNVKPDDGISLEEQRKDPSSLWNYYKTLIELRATHPALAVGGYRSLQNDNDNVLSFLRSSENEQVMVIVNLSGDAQKVTVTPVKNAFRKTADLLGGLKANVKKDKLTVALPAYGVQVYALN